MFGPEQTSTRHRRQRSGLCLHMDVPGSLMTRNPNPNNGHDADQAQVTLDSIADAILSSDAAGNVTYLNAAAEALTGWSAHRSEGPAGRRSASSRERRDARTAHAQSSASRGRTERARRTSGEQRSHSARRPSNSPSRTPRLPIRDRDGLVIGAVIVFHDVSEARASALRMSHLACHDFLTDLPNRVLLCDRITQAIALANRSHKQLGVLFVDLDGFKACQRLAGACCRRRADPERRAAAQAAVPRLRYRESQRRRRVRGAALAGRSRGARGARRGQDH